MTPTELSANIDRALQTVLRIEDFEMTEGFDGAGIDISGDDWTWHLDDRIAWFAIDDEPDNPSDYPVAIERNLTAPVITALRQIEEPVRDELAKLLAASEDPLSLAFAALLLPAS